MRLLIVGAGGFGREVADVVDAVNRVRPTHELLGFVDDGAPDPVVLERRGAALIGSTAELGSWPGAGYVIAIADPITRKRLDGVAQAAGLVPVSLVHPTAALGADVRSASGLVVAAHASVTTNVEIGSQVHVDRRVTIGHDCWIGDFVTLHPGSTISGSVILGAGSRVGSNAVVIQGIEVGEGATIGAGAAVVRDVAPGQTVVGVPARPLVG